MCRVYCGPDAEQFGYEHEGYAARVLPDGTVTASWTAATANVVACVAVCTCGWTGERRRPAEVVGHVGSGRLALAAEVMGRLVADVRTWGDTLERLVEDDAVPRGGR